MVNELKMIDYKSSLRKVQENIENIKTPALRKLIGELFED